MPYDKMQTKNIGDLTRWEEKAMLFGELAGDWLTGGEQLLSLFYDSMKLELSHHCTVNEEGRQRKSVLSKYIHYHIQVYRKWQGAHGGGSTERPRHA